MSQSSETDEAIRRVRDAFDDATEEAEGIGERAKREVEEAIDDLEAQIDRLRNRD
jgi:vacuolar-type H+-ATPase subunit E/Vma4